MRPFFPTMWIGPAWSGGLTVTDSQKGRGRISRGGLSGAMWPAEIGGGLIGPGAMRGGGFMGTVEIGRPGIEGGAVGMGKALSSTASSMRFQQNRLPAIFVRPAFHTSAFAGPGGSPRLSRCAPRTPPMLLHPTECARS